MILNSKQNINNWSLIIKPKKNWFDINLGEIWRYKDLIALLVRRDFVARYKQTILGPIWFIIQPLLTTLMFTIVFSRVAGLSTDELPPVLFYLAGITAWNYFAENLKATSNTFVQNANIFGKVYFPRLIVPISVVISNLIQFGIQFLFLLAFMLYFYLSGSNFTITNHVFLIPVLLLLLAGLGLGFGIIISSLTTKYRDLTNLVIFGVQLWMYATPVVYPLSQLSGTFRFAVLLNPMTSIVETFRLALLGSGTFNWLYLAYSFAFMIITLIVCTLLFNRVEQSFMDTV
ncbi:MAG: ABC transporter permease [Marinilabiliales bacterium]|nr:MAG: ABC transporter permease [Marinilabiliales bacterium]